jgi:hypothetical protein
MNSDSFLVLFDMIILFYGVYMVYCAFQMQKTHRPPNLIINESDLVGARDVKGFCDAMYKPLVCFGILAAIYGVISFVNDNYLDLPAVSFTSVVVFLAMCVWFVRLTKKNRTKYIRS